MKIFNHDWNDPAPLASIGTISEDEVAAISGGLMREQVDVTMNKLALEYDLLLIVGPTFPHEVVGFSGGNKYLFPGIGGPRDPRHVPLAGRADHQPVDHRHQVHAGARGGRPGGGDGAGRAQVRQPGRRGAATWPGFIWARPRRPGKRPSTLSSQIHVVYKDHPYRSVLSCAPPMYDELWVGGKCAYKLEPVVADGGELIIYAPHIHEISVVHGEIIRKIGYHVRDYFLKQLGSSPTCRAACWRTRRTSRASAASRTASKRRASR